MKAKIINYVKSHKIFISVTALVLALCIAIVTTFIVTDNKSKKKETVVSASDISSESELESIASEESSEVLSSGSESEFPSSSVESQSSVPSSSLAPSSSKKPTSSKKPVVSSNKNTSSTSSNKVTNTKYNYNSNTNIENNVFLDSLVYTGYNIKKHRADGLMWVYILASQKRAKDWLSDIHYGGGCTGYETNKKGLPDISRFERGGLVCASFVTYVYFNYLPNVAGIDTSGLAKPEDPHLANSWYNAVKKWVKNGQAKYIKYSDKYNGIKSDIIFKEIEKIPIGSIICFQDYYKKDGHCSHVAVYAGTANGYHWVFHVGNDNGPEFCAIERMNRDPDPQRMLAIISTPTNIRFSPELQVELKDEQGTPIKDVTFNLKDSKGTKTLKTGKTDASGIIKFKDIPYGSYTLVQTVPTGYTNTTASQKITLTTKNNSLNIVKIKDIKIPEVSSEVNSTESTDSQTDSTVISSVESNN